MPIDLAAIDQAVARQEAAAQDPANQVRLVAGPGTGKSYSIEDRVRWLLASGMDPSRLFAVSFTRASTADLEGRIRRNCENAGLPEVAQVSITTLHSLA